MPRPRDRVSPSSGSPSKPPTAQPIAAATPHLSDLRAPATRFATTVRVEFMATSTRRIAGLFRAEKHGGPTAGHPLTAWH